MSSTVLVTGGCGYIGHWIAQDLVRQNYKVVLFDIRPSLEPLQDGVTFIQVSCTFVTSILTFVDQPQLRTSIGVDNCF